MIQNLFSVSQARFAPFIFFELRFRSFRGPRHAGPALDVAVLHSVHEADTWAMAGQGLYHDFDFTRQRVFAVSKSQTDSQGSSESLTIFFPYLFLRVLFLLRRFCVGIPTSDPGLSGLQSIRKMKFHACTPVS